MARHTVALATLMVVLAVSGLDAGQRERASARDLLNDPQTMTKAEMARVRDATLKELADRAFRVTDEVGNEVQIVMNARGGPRYFHTKRAGPEVFEDHTERPAVTCDGKSTGSTLVVEYGRDGSGSWHVRAYPEAAWYSMPRYFEIFNQPLESGGFRVINGHRTRAVMGPALPLPNWRPADGIPPKSKVVLWVDVRTLLPVRWESMVEGVTRGELSFRADAALKLSPPRGVRPVDCVTPD
jgi:hypothetical protein